MAGDGDVVAGELTVGGRPRGFTMRLPRSASDEIPLVLALHGNHPEAGGWTMREWTTFDKQADAWGFAVYYRLSGVVVLVDGQVAVSAGPSIHAAGGGGLSIMTASPRVSLPTIRPAGKLRLSHPAWRSEAEPHGYSSRRS
jgi:hypothetical protein